MEDNPSSDDEIKNQTASPKLEKRVKLNDGSSQEKASSSKSEEENVDSGVSEDSAGKSESTVNTENATSLTSTEALNHVVNAPAPSCSAIMWNIRVPRNTRNYRKRKTPDRGGDSNDSSRDSDDDSAEDSAHAGGSGDSGTDEDHFDIQRFISTLRNESGSGSNSGDGTSDSDSDSNESDDLINEQSGDTDTDIDDYLWSKDNEDDNKDESKKITPDVLNIPKPQHSFIIAKEILNRELGLTIACGKASKQETLFEHKFYGSLHVATRLKKLHNLLKHKGCVNSINFHPEGDLLATGSDDTQVIVWDWARRKVVQAIKSGHKSNVFQSKFMYLNAKSQLNIATCARDGQVRLLQCPPSGGSPTARQRLASHSRAAHKLHVTPLEPHLVVSAGEDAQILHSDVRTAVANKVVTVKDGETPIPLYSVCGHPLEPRELLVAGRDRFVRVYDRRKPNEPKALYCPSDIIDKTSDKKKRSHMHLTCAVYNHDGSEILASYNDEDIYLFDARRDAYSTDEDHMPGYRQRYSGHRNSATFKGVSFWGPRGEFVASGSDCAHVYVWHKNSGALVQWLLADSGGVVNCVEAHPNAPVMATSGLDRDVKLWAPLAQRDPVFVGLEKTIRENKEPHMRRPLFNDFLPSLYGSWPEQSSLPHYAANIEFEGNACTAF